MASEPLRPLAGGKRPGDVHHVEGVGPKMFLDVSIGAAPAGRIIIQLRGDICPITCTNFRGLCTGEFGNGLVTGKRLTYKGTKFHRITKDQYCAAGDFDVGDGTGGECIPFKHAKDGKFPDENFILRHAGPYVVSMHNSGPDTNRSVFYITFARAPMLDDKHVVFGFVCEGHEVVDAIEMAGSPIGGRPVREVVITECGALEGFDIELDVDGAESKGPD